MIPAMKKNRILKPSKEFHVGTTCEKKLSPDYEELPIAIYNFRPI